jgi:hypothetical protein
MDIRYPLLAGVAAALARQSGKNRDMMQVDSLGAVL